MAVGQVRTSELLPAGAGLSQCSEITSEPPKFRLKKGPHQGDPYMSKESFGVWGPYHRAFKLRVV